MAQEQSNGISLNDVMSMISQHTWLIILGLILFSLLSSLIAWWAKKQGRRELAAKFLCPPIFIVTLPGVFFTLIFLYLILFTRSNIMDTSLLVLFVPVWFGITLVFYAKIVDFDEIPGFDKISGLILFCAITFFVLLILLKLRVIFFTWLSPLFVFIAIIILFTLWRKSISKIFGKTN